MDDVQSYAFGRGESQAPLMLSGLDRLGEKLGRRLRALIEPIAGVRPHVDARDAQVLDFAAWAGQVPDFSSIGVYRLSPLKGQVLLRMDAAMISTLVDCFYGGIGNRPLPARGEFTPTEDRLIARISDAFIARLVECWSDMLALEPGLIVRETGIGFAAAAQPGEQQQRRKEPLHRGGSIRMRVTPPLPSVSKPRMALPSPVTVMRWTAARTAMAVGNSSSVHAPIAEPSKRSS